MSDYLREIERLIKEKTPEDTYLDYKGKDSLINNKRNIMEITKDVSSFANAGGGKIIYGVKQKGKIPDSYEEIENIQYLKEWMYQIINNIKPRIEDVEVIPIQTGNDPNCGLLMVIIPRSYTVHQAVDNKYHKRSGDQSLPMEDYEVREGMFRGNAPLLKINTYYFNELHARGDELYLEIANNGRFTAKKWLVTITIDKKLNPKSKGWGQENYINLPTQKFFMFDRERDIHPGLQTTLSGYGFGDYITLLPKKSIKAEVYSCKYRIYAEDMVPQSGEIKIKVDEDRWEVVY
ncbi:MAG: ATP-binding protein [Candidatus Bathyarchaeota archaeon]|nr:ATP-binding protein [Candidatus Bathyarchaeota archaeon]